MLIPPVSSAKSPLHHDIRLLCEIHGPTDKYEVRFLFKSSMLAEFAESNRRPHRSTILAKPPTMVHWATLACLSCPPKVFVDVNSTSFISRKSLHHDIRLLCEIHGPTDNYEGCFLSKSSTLADSAESNRRSTDRQFLQNHRQWSIGRPWLASLACHGLLWTLIQPVSSSETLCSPIFVEPTDPPIIYEGCSLRIQSTLDDFSRPNRPSTDNCCTTTDKWFTGRECSPSIEFDHLKVFGLQDSVTLSNPGFHRHFMKVSTLLFFVKNGSDHSYRPSPGKCTLDSFSDLNLRATDDFRTTDDDSPLGDLDLHVFSPSPAGQGLFRMLIESGSMPEVGEIIQVTAREYYNAASSKTMSIDESGSMKPVLSPERLMSTYSILFETHGSTECIKVFSPSISLTMALNDFIGHVLRTHSTLDDFPGATPNPPLAIQPPIYRPAFSPTKAPAVSMVLSLADVLCVLARMLLNYTSSHNYHEKLNPGASPLKFPTFSSRRLRGLPEAFYSILVTANITCGFTRPESRFVSLSLDLKSLAELVLSTSLSMEKLMQTLLTDAANGSSEAIRDVLTRLQRKGLSAQNRNKGLQRLSDIVLLHLQQPPPTCPTEKFLAKFEPRDTLGPVCFKAVDLAFQHLQGSTREHLLQQWASFCPWLDLFLKKLVATPEADDGEMLYDTMWSIVGHFISHCQTLSLFDSYPGLIALTTGLWIHGSNRNMLSDLHCELTHILVHRDPDFPAGYSLRCTHVLPVEMSEYMRALPDLHTILLDQILKSLNHLATAVNYPLDMVSIILELLFGNPNGLSEPVPGIICRRAVVLFCQVLERIIALPLSRRQLSEFEGLLFRTLEIILHLFRREGPCSIQQALQNQLLQTITFSFQRLTASTLQYIQRPTQRLLSEIADHFNHPNVLRAAVNAVRRLGGAQPSFNYWTTFMAMLERRKEVRKDFKLNPFPCANPEAEQSFLKLKRCGGCLEATYCSRTCQKAHWKQHVLECQPPSTTSQYSMAASPTARAFATEICFRTLQTIALQPPTNDIFQEKLRSCAAHSSVTVIIIPPRWPPNIASAYEVISSHDFCARPDQYTCDGVIKTMLSAAMNLPLKAIIYGPVLDAQGSMCATYNWVEFAFNPFRVYEVNLKWSIDSFTYL
ncbi:hypothetical protein C8J56DRAFT_1064016 [Mycena floridula]|nr:hypothetical protein C8J56DRAFT_1064016 [Mycena floridula]